jgi:ABC-type transport system involved in cytochrome bd biosynthesis fused ATPase/permease subunit
VFDWAAISNALSTLLTAFIIPLAGFAARWFFAKGSFEYSKLTNAQKENFKAFLYTCIYAAEQLDLKGRVGDKLDYVVTLAQEWLAQNRLQIDLAEIKLEIEAIVAREFNMSKILAPKATDRPGETR